MKTINKTNLLTTLMLTSLFSSQVIASSGLVKRYKSSNKKQMKRTLILESKKLKKVKSLTEKMRLEARANFNKTRGKSFENLSLEIEKIKNSRMSQKEKIQRIQKIMLQEKSRSFAAARKVKVDRRNLERQLKRIYPNKKVRIHEVANVSLHSPGNSRPVNYEDIVFDAPYSDAVREEVQNGLSNPGAAVDTEDGSAHANTFAFEIGTAFAKAGVIESLRVPEGIHKVKVSSVVDVTNFRNESVSILGMGSSHTGVFVEMMDSSGRTCLKEQIVGSSIAPIIWYNQSEGEDLIPVACELEVEPGTEIVVSAGDYSFSAGFLASLVTGRISSIVNKISVEFVE